MILIGHLYENDKEILIMMIVIRMTSYLPSYLDTLKPFLLIRI